MAAWKQDQPDSSLKLQRRLFERGLITKLPWDERGILRYGGPIYK